MAVRPRPKPFVSGFFAAALEGKARQLQEFKEDRVEPGTIDAVIVNFYRSTDFQKLKYTTQRVRKNVLEKFRVLHGKKRVALLTAAHLKAIIGDMADRPGAANNLLKVLRVLLRHAIDMGLIQDNPPAMSISLLSTRKAFTHCRKVTSRHLRPDTGQVRGHILPFHFCSTRASAAATWCAWGGNISMVNF
jgi:hypothetical protein